MGGSNYTELSCIGRGSSASCHACTDHRNGGLCVLKRLRLSSLEDTEQALREASHLRGMQHPGIVSYRDTFVDNESLCIVMEHCEGGDLAQRVATAGAHPH